MDNIYFLVLSIWRVLTGHKKVLVALVGVTAVVVTVTTVMASPPVVEEHESGPETFVSMDPPPVSSLLVMSAVSPDQLGGLSIGGVSSPGILPTSPFYFVKDLTRGVQYAFTFDPIEKATLRLRYANEDALAIHAMCIAGEYIDAAQECFRYQDDFFTSLACTVQARKQGSDVEALMLNLRNAHHAHRLILADSLGIVDESQLEAVIGAITYTSAPLEQVINWTQGPDEASVFHTRLQDDLSTVGGDVWLQIENRLGLDVQQAVELSKAMGNDSTVDVAPIISSVKADLFEVDPGAAVAITCSASDLSGGALTYNWVSSGGDLDSNNANVVNWTAPEDLGVYTVTVAVTNDRGSDSKKSISIRVGKAGQTIESGGSGAFRIREFEVTPDGHNMLKPPSLAGSEWTVLTGRSVIITCVVDGDASNLTFDWSCVHLAREGVNFVEGGGPAGTISGSGETVTWAAYSGAGYARVSVVVRDSDGVVQRGSVDFRVSTCATCFSTT